MKIVCVVGARPNFVKIAPLLKEMRKSGAIEARLVHTGQHYDAEMSASFFRDLEIPRPDFNLGVGSAGAVSQTKEIMNRLEPLLAEENPHLVVVVGDVNSTLAGALAATKVGIPVAHVEAGLRSFDRRMPEEINRILTDAVSDLLFASEPSGVENLRREGIPADRIFLVGNIMIDTLRASLAQACRSTVLRDLGLAERPGLPPRGGYALLTLHRQGLVDDPDLFKSVWQALEAVAREVPIIFPVHPRTQRRLGRFGVDFRPRRESGRDSAGIHMVGPLGYLQFLHLERAASLVMTDSGGVQEETTALGVPCLTLRENTERPITVTEGTNTIVGFDPERIYTEARRALMSPREPIGVPRFWDGCASRRIVETLCDYDRPWAHSIPERSAKLIPFQVPSLAGSC
jgi:UDP-N-acetylglucosamine 2-epimerase (non-hydrolysing)